MRIELDADTAALAAEQAAKSGDKDVAALITRLLREDMERQQQWRRDLERVLLERVRSGESVPVTHEDFERIRQEGRRLLQARQARQAG